MKYQPKPGDRVTSPLLVGEWEVTDADDITTRVIDRHRDAVAYVLPEALVPVAPPLPPEPTVGSVVRANGRYWTRHGNTWHHHGPRRSTGECENGWVPWDDLATADDLSPVVAVDDVAYWLDDDLVPPGTAERFRSEFGWDK